MVILAYQIVSIAAYAAVLIWALRSRNPISLGAVLGGFMLWGFDWLWCSRGFWNATTAGNEFMIPGLNIQGVQYPFAIACTWGVGYGFLPLLVSKAYGNISRSLGVLHFPVMLAACAITDLTIEAILISGLHVYAYHMAPQYLLFGVAWCNAWFLGGLLTASYFGLAHAEKWAALPQSPGFALNAESTWKGITMAAASILTPAFLLGVVQFFWFSAAQPWVESGRPF